ncbi:MAG: GNAT family N-acetyltransferase [Alphaproteobacteria bacterium]
MQLNNYPNLKFSNYNIRLLEENDANECVRFYKHNQTYLAPYETITNEHFNINYWKNKIIKNRTDFEAGLSCYLGVFEEEKLIGMINFSNIIRGVFQSCFLGYKIDQNYQGLGIMKNAVKTALKYIFEVLNLHRVSANYLPYNTRSAKLLESLGFKQEGIALKYLYINGKWEDHILTSLINEEWKL